MFYGGFTIAILVYQLINTYLYNKIHLLLFMVAEMDFDEDFKVLNNAIISFLKRESIRDKFQHILKRPNKDWEKWLQVELEYHLEKYCRCTAKREVPALPDHRYRTGKVGMYVDLIIRKKKFEDEHYMYVELKCDDTVDSLYNKMIADAKKLQSIKQSFLEKSNKKMRSYWCIGFFQTTNLTHTKEMRNYLNEVYSTKTACKIVNICTCFVADDSCKCDDIGYIIF